MSRTRKDRPYWVKAMADGVETHYHHANRYGRRAQYEYKQVLDDEGNPVMEDRIIKMTAKRAVETLPRTKSVPYSEDSPWWKQWQGFYQNDWRPVSYKLANPVYSEAQHLVAMGMPNAEVIVSIDSVPKYEKVLKKAANLECDYDEEVHTQREYWTKNCSKVLPNWKAGYSCRCSWCKPGDEPRQRTRKRTFVSNMVKAANSGEEHWEDNFNELDLAQPDMHHRGWC